LHRNAGAAGVHAHLPQPGQDGEPRPAAQIQVTHWLTVAQQVDPLKSIAPITAPGLAQWTFWV
jgi:carbohydrate-selective porin OprB